PEYTRPHLVAHWLSLGEIHDELPGGDLVLVRHHLDVDLAGVALALLVDDEDRYDDLLQRRAAVDEPRAAARELEPVDRLGDLNLDVAVESQLFGTEGGEGVVGLQPVPEDVAPVGHEDLVALRL